MQNHEGWKKPQDPEQSSEGRVNQGQKQWWKTKEYSGIDSVLTVKAVLGKKNRPRFLFLNLIFFKQMFE